MKVAYNFMTCKLASFPMAKIATFRHCNNAPCEVYLELEDLAGGLFLGDPDFLAEIYRNEFDGKIYASLSTQLNTIVRAVAMETDEMLSDVEYFLKAFLDRYWATNPVDRAIAQRDIEMVLVPFLKELSTCSFEKERYRCCGRLTQ